MIIRRKEEKIARAAGIVPHREGVGNSLRAVFFLCSIHSLLLKQQYGLDSYVFGEVEIERVWKAVSILSKTFFNQSSKQKVCTFAKIST